MPGLLVAPRPGTGLAFQAAQLVEVGGQLGHRAGADVHPPDPAAGPLRAVVDAAVPPLLPPHDVYYDLVRAPLRVGGAGIKPRPPTVRRWSRDAIPAPFPGWTIWGANATRIVAIVAGMPASHSWRDRWSH